MAYRLDVRAADAGRQASARRCRRRRRCASVSRRRGLRVRGFLFPIGHETYQRSVVSPFMSVLMQLS